MDYASLTPVDPKVLREMEKYSGIKYANPSSWHKEGVAANKAIVDARKRIASFLHARPEEIVFTSGGTEANNLALIGPIESLHKKGVEYEKMHVIVSAIEHSSVTECINTLNEKGVQVSVIPVDENGTVSLEELKKQIKSNTVIISIIMVNNEVGVIEPIRDIVKIVRQARKEHGAEGKEKEENIFSFQSDVSYPLFHTDAAQAMYMNLNVDELGIDMLTLDSGKMYGPRSVGALYVKKNTQLEPIMYGGGQEGGMRSGTENVASIMGFARALDIISVEREHEYERLTDLKGFFIDQLKEFKPEVKILSDGAETSPHILNISIPGVENEFFVFELDAKGISCSTKSSCLHDEDESYVLKAMDQSSKNSVRFSFGRFTKMSDVRKVISVIKELIK